MLISFICQKNSKKKKKEVCLSEKNPFFIYLFNIPFVDPANNVVVVIEIVVVVNLTCRFLH